MVGRVIGGKYRIDSVIGQGGMATVYKAHSLEDGSLVAIKFLKEENQKNAEYLRRFEREAQAGMTLSHNNIVKLLDVGVEDGANYIVFEFVGGPTLKTYMEKTGVFTPTKAVNIVAHILDAIGYAHDHGIIHRDVKPQNVIITTSGAVKLADFGIARAVGASTKTFSGNNVLGSVHYISPEQAAGKEATCQSDLYSVGIILYEMLTGCVPFDGENMVSVALKHMKDKIKPPASLNPEIPYSLNAVIMKATAKNQKLRYQTAEEMKNDLLRTLKEPDGTFADMDSDADIFEQDNDDEEQGGKKKLNTGILVTLGVLGVCIIGLVIAFLIVQAQYKPSMTVSSLVGKTVEEAEKIIEDKFELEIKYESSDTNPGYIISQEPVQGSRVQKGAKIKVTVSIGSEHVAMPDLSGYTLSQANSALAEKGLAIDKVIYEQYKKAQPGTVFLQEPAFGTELSLNSGVTLHICGTPEATAKVPQVTGIKSIDSAVTKLNEKGFANIRVRFVADAGTTEGSILSQNFDKGLEIDTSSVIELSVSGTNGKATYDFACNITVDGDNTPVLVTVDTGKGYEVVVYEDVVNSGSTTISCPAKSVKAGTFDCKLYVSETVYKTISGDFTIN